MDIDAAQRKGGVSVSACYQCRKPGHWACSCPEGLSICYLSADKQDMLIIELLAAKDAAGIPSLEVVDRVLEDGEEDALEDF